MFDIVSRHCAPLTVLRRTVGLWHDDLPQDHCLKEPAEDVRLTLFPEYVANTVQPAKQRQQAWHDELPKFRSLPPLSFACSGEPTSFHIPKRHQPLLVLPWKGFGTLRAAQARLLWTQAAVQRCCEAVTASQSRPVCIHFSADGICVLPLLVKWLQDLGFEVQGSEVRSPMLHRI